MVKEKEILEEELLEESLLKSDFTFGFELEAIADSSYYGNYYDEDEYDEDDEDYESNDSYMAEKVSDEIDNLFNKHSNGEWSAGEMQHDGSINPDDRYDYPFEWASPVLDVKPINFARVIRFLDSLKSHGIYVNDSCGFHHHLSWRSITERDMIWTYTNICMDKEFIDSMEQLDDIDMSSSHWASKDILNDIRKYVKDRNYVGLLGCYNDSKYRIFRIHPYGTIEWRGPRNFLERRNIDIIKDFYVKFNTLIKKVIECQNMKTIDGTDITKEEFFNNLKEAQKDEKAPHPSEGMRDNMEFLYRTGEYRGDRKLRYKTEKGIGKISQRYIDALVNNPSLLAKVLRKANDDEIDILIKTLFTNYEYSGTSKIARLFNEMFQYSVGADDVKEGSQFMKNLTKIVTNVCKSDINYISRNFGSEILKYIDTDKLFNESLKLVEEKIDNNNFRSFINTLDDNDYLLEKITFNKFFEILRKYAIAEKTSLITDCADEICRISLKFNPEKIGLKNIAMLIVKCGYKSGRLRWMGLRDIYFVAKKAYTTPQEIASWDTNILGLLFESGNNYSNVTRLLIDTDDEVLLKGLVAYCSRHSDNVHGFGFNDAELERKVSKWINN